MAAIGEMKTTPLAIAPDTKEFDEWIRSLRLLVSQIGFALDGYLAGRPSADVSEHA